MSLEDSTKQDYLPGSSGTDRELGSETSSDLVGRISARAHVYGGRNAAATGEREAAKGVTNPIQERTGRDTVTPIGWNGAKRIVSLTSSLVPVKRQDVSGIQIVTLY